MIPGPFFLKRFRFQCDALSPLTITIISHCAFACRSPSLWDKPHMTRAKRGEFQMPLYSARQKPRVKSQLFGATRYPSKFLMK